MTLKYTSYSVLALEYSNKNLQRNGCVGSNRESRSQQRTKLETTYLTENYEAHDGVSKDVAL